MILCPRTTTLRHSQRLLRRPRRSQLNLPAFSEAKVSHCLDQDCDDFLPWLKQKAGAKISSVLSIRRSGQGRLMFASSTIQAGDCILKVPYNVQIAPDNLLPEIKPLLRNEVGDVAKLAIIILFQQRMGWNSEWAPYVRRLPPSEEMHNTIFWSETELEMIRQSSLYEETIRFSINFQKYLKKQHAWISCMHVLWLDLGHREAQEEWLWDSEAIVLSDEDMQYSEVIADRDYAPGEQVLIRYGKYSNATLMLDFGFTLPCNIHDQVQLEVNILEHDLLREKKLEILHRDCTPTINDDNGFNSSSDLYTIKEVRSIRGKGRGIPQSLRAFARILSCTSSQELSDLAAEAAQNDGRLARRPLKSIDREIQAHRILISRIAILADQHCASLESLEHVDSVSMSKTHAHRRQMARDLLAGELRVLQSAAAWLRNYCATLCYPSLLTDSIT